MRLSINIFKIDCYALDSYRFFISWSIGALSVLWNSAFMQFNLWKLQCMLQIDITEIVRIDYEHKKEKKNCLMLPDLEAGARWFCR